jgi:hypothetical protein
LSLAWEWNITESDPSVSMDIAFGWSFCIGKVSRPEEPKERLL